MASILAILFYLAGILATTAVLLAYEEKAFWIVQNIVGLMLGTLSVMYLYDHLHAESILLGSLTISFILSSRVNMRDRDWLFVTLTVVNTIIGSLLLASPELLNPPFEISQNEKITSIAVGVAFLLSALIGLLALVRPELINKARLLAIPWLVWGAFYIIPPSITTLTISTGVCITLLLFGFLPWERLVLHDGKQIGRRFIHLILTSQTVSFGLVIWLLYILETNTSILPEQVHIFREVVLVSFNITAMLAILVIASVNLSINGMFLGLTGEGLPQENHPPSRNPFRRLLENMMQPFHSSYELLAPQIQRKHEIERLLQEKLVTEKHRSAQLSLLRQLNHQLEVNYDVPVSAQLTCNAIYEKLGGDVVAVFQYESESSELVLAGVSGPGAWTVPAGYRQNISKGVLGRALRTQETQLISDTRNDPDHLQLREQDYLSEIAVPLLYQNQARGVIIVANSVLNAFDDSDVRTLETVALRLVTSWHRNAHDQHLTGLIEAGADLISRLDVQSAIETVAGIAAKTLDARFTVVALVNRGGGAYDRIVSHGQAPRLLADLKNSFSPDSLVQVASNGDLTLRLNDVRKQFPDLTLDNLDLRSLLAVPIHLRHSRVGCILAFGKKKNTVFDEDDEALAALLTIQAGTAIETARLVQEVRLMLDRAVQLYDLSTRVIQSAKLSEAAAAIAEIIFKKGTTDSAGIILLSSDGKNIDVKVSIDENGIQAGAQHPLALVWQSLDTGQMLAMADESDKTHVCVPIQTPRRQYGALWIVLDTMQWENPGYSNNVQTIANTSAIALERAILLAETRAQADALEVANRQLEISYDQTLRALSSALDARDRETEGHSRRVTVISTRIGIAMGMNEKESQIFERGALLHDIGKIGISDLILLKPGKLTDDEWKIMRQHPDIGAHIVDGIPFLKDSLPVIRCHHEKWDGTGYPLGLKGPEIPLMARIFSIVDNFDALTSIRPYRKRITNEEAIEYLKEKVNEHFDADIVHLFEKMYFEGAFNDVLQP